MAATVIKADVLALPKLSTQLGTMDDSAWVAILAFVNEFDMEQVESEATTHLARIYLAAHLALTTKQAFTGAAGPVTGEGAGQVRRSYGLLATAAGTNSLNGTQYGQALLAILSLSAAHGPVLV